MSAYEGPYTHTNTINVVEMEKQWEKKFHLLPKRSMNGKLIFGRMYVRSMWMFDADDAQWFIRTEYLSPKEYFRWSLKNS